MIALLGLGACSSSHHRGLSSSPTATTYSMQIEVTSDACIMSDFAHDNFSDGTDVVVKDTHGNVIGSGTAAPATNFCAFPVSISGLPQTPFYSIVPGNASPFAWSFTDAQNAGWQIHLDVSQSGTTSIFTPG